MSSTIKMAKAFGADGSSDWVTLNGRRAVLNIYGNGVGTVTVERKASDGTTAVPLAMPDGTAFAIDKATGDLLSFNLTVSKIDDEMRITVSSYASGTINAEILQ